MRTSRPTLSGSVVTFGLLPHLVSARRSGELSLQLTKDIGVTLRIASGRLLAVFGSLAPKASDLLASRGESEVERVRKLWEEGTAGMDPVYLDVLREQAIYALLPIWTREVQTAFHPGEFPEGGIPLTTIFLTLEDRLSDMEEEDPRAWVAPPRVSPLNSPLKEPLRLANLAPRWRLPWDRLVPYVRELEREGVIELRDQLEGSISPGSRLPNITLPRLDGTYFSLASWREMSFRITLLPDPRDPHARSRWEKLSARESSLAISPSPIPEGKGLVLLDPDRKVAQLLGAERRGFGLPSRSGWMPLEAVVGPGLRLVSLHKGKHRADYPPLDTLSEG